MRSNSARRRLKASSASDALVQGLQAFADGHRLLGELLGVDARREQLEFATEGQRRDHLDAPRGVLPEEVVLLRQEVVVDALARDEGKRELRGARVRAHVVGGDLLQLALDAAGELGLVMGPLGGVFGREGPLVGFQRELRVDGHDPLGGLDVRVGARAVDDGLLHAVHLRWQDVREDCLQLDLPEAAPLLWSVQQSLDVAVEGFHLPGVGLEFPDRPVQVEVANGAIHRRLDGCVVDAAGRPRREDEHGAGERQHRHPQRRFERGHAGGSRAAAIKSGHPVAVVVPTGRVGLERYPGLQPLEDGFGVVLQ
jgi:hypothetical protein